MQPSCYLLLLWSWGGHVMQEALQAASQQGNGAACQDLEAQITDLRSQLATRGTGMGADETARLKAENARLSAALSQDASSAASRALREQQLVSEIQQLQGQLQGQAQADARQDTLVSQDGR